MAPPAQLPDDVRAAWARLESSGAADARFDPATVHELPAPVARWAVRAIDPGAPLCLAARLTMHGHIRVGRWLPFTAAQVLTLPDGFVWAADAGRFPLRIRGFDRFSDGTGEMRWRLLGRLPVMRASGDDVTRSAAGRLAGEAMLVPTAPLALGVPWTAVDDRQAIGEVTIGARTHRVTVTVDEAGDLTSVALPRWGNPDNGPHREHTFGVEMGGSRRIGPVRVPTTLRAGWWYGTDRWDEGEFFRATIDDVVLLDA